MTLSIKSSSSVAKHKIAINSEATVIVKLSLRSTPLPSPKPTTISRSALSFISIALDHKIRSASICKGLPRYKELSIIAAIKLIEEVNACISPVKCKLISSLGSIVAFPPPVAPPLIPKTGPKEGSLKTNIAFCPIFPRPSAKLIEVVVLPSPAFVGVIAVTRTNLPSSLLSNSFIIDKSIFALSLP